MNSITTKEFNTRKNDQVTVCFFKATKQDPDPDRDLMYGNISLFKALDEIQTRQTIGYCGVIVSSDQAKQILEIEDKKGSGLRSRITKSELMNLIKRD